MANKFYAVKKGYHPGIYETWVACQQEVSGYSGAQYKSFKSRQEALDYLNGDVKKAESDEHGLVAYVDGSYNIKTKVYGAGVILLDHGVPIQKLTAKGSDPEYATMRNVAGEIMGCLVAVRFAIEHGYQAITIYYDYRGIEMWATGQWQANKPGTQAYHHQISTLMKQIDVDFVKVTAHSGDHYNDVADELAKKAAGIL